MCARPRLAAFAQHHAFETHSGCRAGAVRVSSPALVTAERRRVLWTPPRWLTRSLVGGLCAVSRFELLRVKLLQTFVYRSVFLFFSGKCREVELQVIC